jgi:hypothetical protein
MPSVGDPKSNFVFYLLQTRGVSAAGANEALLGRAPSSACDQICLAQALVASAALYGLWFLDALLASPIAGFLLKLAPLPAGLSKIRSVKPVRDAKRALYQSRLAQRDPILRHLMEALDWDGAHPYQVPPGDPLEAYIWYSNLKRIASGEVVTM